MQSNADRAQNLHALVQDVDRRPAEPALGAYGQITVNQARKLADKAKKMGIPLFDFRKGGGA